MKRLCKIKQTYLNILIMAIFFLNIAPFKYTKASDTTNELLLDSCHNRELMDYFFKQQNNKITNCDSLYFLLKIARRLNEASHVISDF